MTPASLREGGITVLPWPPGPLELSGHLPISFTTSTRNPRIDAAGSRACDHTDDLTRGVLEAGYRTVALAASDDGRSMYESLGYRESPQPYMFVTLSH